MCYQASISFLRVLAEPCWSQLCPFWCAHTQAPVHGSPSCWGALCWGQIEVWVLYREEISEVKCRTPRSKTMIIVLAIWTQRWWNPQCIPQFYPSTSSCSSPHTQPCCQGLLVLLVSDIQASLVKSPCSITLLFTAEYIRSKSLQPREGFHSVVVVRWQVFLVGKMIDFGHSFGLF